MGGMLIQLSSVTYAIRAQKVLEKHGIRSSVRRITNNSKIDGCGYGLEIYGDVEKAQELISGAGIRITGIVTAV